VRAARVVRTALRGLRRNVLRAILTTLGIIIGIASVIAMMEIGQGSTAAIQKTISSMGANTILVMPGTAASGGVSFGAGSVLTLTPQDCDAILKECPNVSNAAPLVRARAQVIYGNRNWVPLQISGTTPAYLGVRDWNNLASGAMFTDRDVRNAGKVCVVGQTLVRELFAGQDPVGRDIRIQNVTFKVVGVLASKGANMMGSDQDDVVLAPWTTIKYRVSGTPSSASGAAAAGSASSTSGQVNSLSQTYAGTPPQLYPAPSPTQAADTPLPVRFTNIDQILASAASAADVQPAIAQITQVLRERHHIREGEPEDFIIRNMAELTAALTKTSSLMTTLLLCVALISLVVGGVGIMNIMLVSVTERTREIGLRMAVGARSRDILAQFLAEAVALCLAGGALGILFGRGSSFLVTLLLHWPTQSSLTAVVAAVGVSAAVGVGFGFYPAWKASRLDPIEALRYE
jgi:ABC-type antimicrobial peptide transport system permease subunit